jgi:uncharacterized phage-associated protein
MANIMDVANYFILKSHNEQGDNIDITLLKLQKLCYYAQGVHLATKDNSLFSNELLAWEHGPVVKELHDRFGKRGAIVLEKPEAKIEDLKLNADELQTLEDVYSYFGQFSAWKLRNMTHQEAPWIQTLTNSVISIDVIKTYFKENIIA